MTCLCELFKGRWPGVIPEWMPPHPDYGDDNIIRDDSGSGVEYREGMDERPHEAADPLTGGYTSPLTLTRSSAMVGEGPSDLLNGPVPFQRLWELHAPTDRVTPQFPALAQARGLQVVDLCTPNTDWQHNYGYIEIEDTQGPALESPRYSYAAIDSNDLLDEARARVLGALR